MRLNLNFIILIAAVSMASHSSYAAEQTLDDQEILNVEGLYKSNALPVEKAAKPTLPKEVKDENTEVQNSEQKSEAAQAKAQKQNQKIDTITDLNKLAEFREISVIQKKYLPKTERFQLYGGLGTTTNSPWFLNLGAKINFGYYFSESFGLELSGVFLSNSERQVAKEIRDNNNLQPEKFVNTKSYLGLDFVWAPIYGKIAMLNQRIIPFDMYFSAGGGTSNTNSVEGSVPTFHVGTGQIFAISKAIAFRWDYSWTFFQATPIADSSLGAQSIQKNSYNDLILTAGFSFFFPEAKYR